MFDRLRYKLSNFMMGRNGNDDLNKLIAGIAIVGAIASWFLKTRVLTAVYTFFFVLYIVRYLSKNIPARQRENDVVMGFFKYLKIKWQMRKTHKVFRCKNCLRIVRVPRNHGRVEVTCPQCGMKKTIDTGAKN